MPPLGPQQMKLTKPNKYRAKRIQYEGMTFDSTKEMRRWIDLRLLERAGKIRQLRRQVPFTIVINDEPVKIKSAGYPNGRQVKYIADFTYVEDNAYVVEDVKGKDTQLSRLKRALVEAIYGHEVRLT